MADRTNIGWTDATWNPITGCSKVSTGCANCYAAALAPRLAAMGAKGYTDQPWTASNAEQNVQTHADRLEIPLKPKSPRKFFVNSTSDLFHDKIPASFIARIFAVMMAAEHHTFQVLTKRPERMAALLNDRNFSLRMLPIAYHELTGDCPDTHAKQWPLPNLWLGVSVEDQRAADERIPHLLDTPAALRFLSCEPLLGPVDLTNVPLRGDTAMIPTGNCLIADLDGNWFIGWVIAGGESGPNHRHMKPGWARSLRDQARAAGIPFFFKQKSARWPESDIHLDGEVIRQFLPCPTLLVAGESPVVETLAAVAEPLGFRLARLGAGEEPEALELPHPRDTWMVVATFGAFDEEAIEVGMRLGLPYIGLVASERRAGSVLSELCARGYDEEGLEIVRSPAGLPLGVGGPEGISLSHIPHLQAVTLGLACACL